MPKQGFNTVVWGDGRNSYHTRIDVAEQSMAVSTEQDDAAAGTTYLVVYCTDEDCEGIVHHFSPEPCLKAYHFIDGANDEQIRH